MKLKNFAFLFVIVAALSINVFSQASKKLQASAKATIAAFIKKEAKKNDADEYPPVRKVVYGDLDRDGDQDAAVLYTLEGFGGGNFWVQTLAVFLNTKGSFKFYAQEDVGAKNRERSGTLRNIKSGKVWMDMEYCEEPPQGLCAEPKKGVSYFTLSSKKLEEVNVTAAS